MTEQLINTMNELRHWFESERKSISKGNGSQWSTRQCEELMGKINEILAANVAQPAPEQPDYAQTLFEQWFVWHYPGDTVLHDPMWHAQRIYRSAISATQLAPKQDEIRNAVLEEAARHIDEMGHPQEAGLGMDQWEQGIMVALQSAATRIRALKENSND
jgi:hypothetical protein